ncbi:hypothetical protein CMV_018715 [Castanea mollissima]|uniref:Uncharacterized protein n=1 Tax=Castanea mollissima TaxID=60419 RepID=A0A8J4QP46_9ROSI|nr:hypothetical protein CMV_018715 [Castanea mollissima]
MLLIAKEIVLVFIETLMGELMPLRKENNIMKQDFLFAPCLKSTESEWWFIDTTEITNSSLVLNFKFNS